MRERNKTRRVPLALGDLGPVEIFRIGPGPARDVAVDAWFASDPTALKAIAHEWFGVMRDCGSDVCERLHDGCPVACIDDAPFGYVNAFKSHVNVGFFYGAMLDDPAGLLEGSGKRMRHVKLRADLLPNAAALRGLVVASYADIRARLAARRDADE